MLDTGYRMLDEEAEARPRPLQCRLLRYPVSSIQHPAV